MLKRWNVQQSANKDSVALRLKLNELLASHRSANNQLIGIEDASEEELRRLAAAYLRLATDRPEVGTRIARSAESDAKDDVERCLSEVQSEANR